MMLIKLNKDNWETWALYEYWYQRNNPDKYYLANQQGVVDYWKKKVPIILLLKLQLVIFELKIIEIINQLTCQSISKLFEFYPSSSNIY